MPKEGYQSITVPDALYQRIQAHLEKSHDFVPSTSQAINRAWEHYERYVNEEPEKYTVEIAGKKIGPRQPIYMIAEIGINHNGDMKICKQLIDVAVEAGCDAVKFQKRNVDVVYTREELEKPRESPFGKTNGDLKRGLEFGEKEYKEIDKYCKEKGITWFASPWDESSVDFLEKFDVPCYKIASASLTDRGLLERVKKTGKPIILSTGMSEPYEIRKAVDLLGEENIVLMSCVSTYPTMNLEDTNLKVINTLQKLYRCPAGYSGHESDTFPTLIAMGLGAHAIERHITLNRTLGGSDQASSLEPKGLQMICGRAKQIPLILGDGKKKLLDSEVPIQQKLRRLKTL